MGEIDQKTIDLCQKFLSLELLVMSGSATEEDKKSLQEIKKEFDSIGISMEEARKVAAADFAGKLVGIKNKK